MCYFLAIGVRSSGAALLNREGTVPHRGEQLSFHSVLNSSLAAIFPADDQLFWVTSGMCSCSLYSYDRNSDPASQRRKYELKGWSEAKIARALDQGVAAKAKHGTRNSKPKLLLYELLLRLTTCEGGVRVFSHFYHGQPDKEQVTSASQSTVGVNALSCEESFPDDTLVEVAGAVETVVHKS